MTSIYWSNAEMQQQQCRNKSMQCIKCRKWCLTWVLVFIYTQMRLQAHIQTRRINCVACIALVDIMNVRCTAEIILVWLIRWWVKTKMNAKGRQYSLGTVLQSHIDNHKVEANPCIILHNSLKKNKIRLHDYVHITSNLKL